VSGREFAIVALVIGIIVIGVARTIATRVYARHVTGMFSIDANGVIVGAGPIERKQPGRGRAALLLHGFGDTPQTLHYLATVLAEHGWSVRAPLLPGHGRTVTEWARTGAVEWVAAAREELRAMTVSQSPVALIGLSMGGALAAIVQAEAEREMRAGSGHARPASAVILLAPYLALPGAIEMAATLHPILGLVMPYYGARGTYSILDPLERARNLAYGVTTPRLVHELGKVAQTARESLPDITVPTLIVQSHNDNRIAPEVAESALARLGSRDKSLAWSDEGAHVITVDRGRRDVIDRVSEWLEAHVRDLRDATTDSTRAK